MRQLVGVRAARHQSSLTQNALGPPPTSVGQGPHPSVTVKRTVVACPVDVRDTRNVSDCAPGGADVVCPCQTAAPLTAASMQERTRLQRNVECMGYPIDRQARFAATRFCRAPDRVANAKNLADCVTVVQRLFGRCSPLFRPATCARL